jgi:hypothetical protein
MNNINRRESPRLDIRLRCQVMAPAAWGMGAMQTENISRGGVLIAWRGDSAPTPLPVIGQMLTVEIELPASHDFGRKCIHCEGSVARIAGVDAECPRVAIRVNYMDFRSVRAPISAYEGFRPAAGSWMA